MNEHVPKPALACTVTEHLIKHLRKERADWRNAMPEASWSHDQIQRAIGANEVNTLSYSVGAIRLPDHALTI